MKLEQLMRLIVIAIVLMVAFAVLGVVLKFGTVLLNIGIRVLFLLFVVAVILRLVEYIRSRK